MNKYLNCYNIINDNFITYTYLIINQNLNTFFTPIMPHFNSSIRPSFLLLKLISPEAEYILLYRIRDTEKHFLMSRQ